MSCIVTDSMGSRILRIVMVVQAFGVKRWALSMLVLCACGRIGYDPIDARTDARDLADSPIGSNRSDVADREAGQDASVGARPALCGFDAGQWHVESTRLTATSSNAEEAEPRLSADGLTLFFVRYGVGGFFVRRATRADPFSGPVVAVGGVEGGGVGLSPAGDGSFAWIARSQSGLTRRSDLWRMRRSSTAPLAYAYDVEETALNTDEAEWDPVLSRDTLRIYFVSPRGAMGQQILTATRPSTAALFGAPSEVVGVNTSGHEDNPSLTEDESVIVFSRRATDDMPRDLFIATRPARDAPFAPATPLVELNSERNETEPYLSGDGCELFYAVEEPQPARFELYHGRIVAGPPR
jgi:hypothetical protein